MLSTLRLDVVPRPGQASRTAARLVRERLPVEALRQRGLVFRWAAAQLDGRCVLCLEGRGGRSIQLEVPWVDDLNQLVASALERLEQHLEGNAGGVLRRLFRRRRPPVEGS